MKLQPKSKISKLAVLLLVLLMLATLIPSVFANDASAESSVPGETMVALGEAPLDVAAPADTEKAADAAPAGDDTTTIGAEEADEWTSKVCSTANVGGDACKK